MKHLLPSRSDRRGLRLLALILVTLVVGSACGDDDSGSVGAGSDAALSVNDFTLTNAEFEDQLVEWAKLFPPEETAGAGEGTYAMPWVSGRATVNVQFAALIDGLEEADIDVTEAHVEAAKTDTEQQLEQAKTQIESTDAEYVAPSDEFIEMLVSWTAAQNAAIEHVEVEPEEVSEADVAQAYAQYPESICSAHILVDTKAEADEIRELLNSGQDFATLAKERSTDTGSGAEGGDLGCVPKGTFVPEFEKAALAATPGEVTEPVESEFGFHLILVASVGVPPLDEVSEEITTQLDPVAVEEAAAATGAAFEAFIADVFDSAEIDVNAKYGTWDAELQQVVPPEGSTPETTEPPAVPDPALTPEPAPVPEEE